MAQYLVSNDLTGAFVVGGIGGAIAIGGILLSMWMLEIIFRKFFD